MSNLEKIALLIKEASILLSPVLIESTPKVFTYLGVTDTSYEHILDFDTVSNKVVSKAEALFPRLDTKIENEYIASKMKG